MYFRAALTASLATTALAQVRQGFNYGATNEDGSCRGYEDFVGYFNTAKSLAGTSGFTSARLYTSIQCGTVNDPISAYQAAIDTDTSILVGLWASAGRGIYENELNSLLRAAEQYGTAFTDRIVGISVGSEDLYRSSPDGVASNAGVGATGAEIEGYIGWLRDWIRGTALEGKPIGHVDTWTAWVRPENAGVAASVDWLGHNSFPYFESTKPNSIEQGPENFWSAVGNTESVAGGKPVFITETGWPHRGPQQGAAVASVDNARTYWSQVGCALFGQRNVWWYTLTDANTAQTDISFGTPKLIILDQRQTMEVIAAGIAWALNKTISPQQVLSRLGFASLVSQNITSSWPDLSSQLSPRASIVFPNEVSFGDSVSRWREWHAPEVSVVVNAFTESDVQATIRNAIAIDLRSWDNVDIAEDGKSATIGGGASVKKVVNTLWTAGKQTARVVLPNGEAVTASKETNPDLFWALQGAGHNFGIVTEWHYRIHDVKNKEWGYEILIYLGDKLEEVLELTNKMMLNQPPEITHWMYFVNIPEIDPTRPIIWYAIIHDGHVNKTTEYAKPLHDIEHVTVETGSVPMPNLAEKTFMGTETIGCAKGYTGLRYPIGLKKYDLAATRKVFDDITDMSNRIPEFAGSFFLLEGYSTHGVKAVNDKDSAFPHRDDEILVTSYIMYKPNSSLDALAQEYGERLRGHLLRASEDPERLRAYVNYAHGIEPVESIYGWDEWRLKKLRTLKKKWDPENRMRLYNPLV
ncbi:FAD-dependent oxygenase [Colletotrichum truncatum]|uniref:FAD-dependent oxygenase n=1 Tax=Colletotrichum truncatum TaxID=5467 RepID=A0ACC3ZH68_COLTU